MPSQDAIGDQMPKEPLENTGSNQSDSGRKRIKHLLIGSRKTVKATINTLHVLGYSETREWSKPQSAGVLGESGDVVSVLFRYVLPE
jgi:hypothetical protein